MNADNVRKYIECFKATAFSGVQTLPLYEASSAAAAWPASLALPNPVRGKETTTLPLPSVTGSWANFRDSRILSEDNLAVACASGTCG